jgi:hypothetical protein
MPTTASPWRRARRWSLYGLAAAALLLTAAAPVCGSPDQSSAATPAPTAPAAPTLPPPPPIVVRTPIAGAAKGGLFADGVTNLASANTAGWKTFSNSKYGFTFRYPADWLLSESDSSGLHGPNGEPYNPLYRVQVGNPAAEAGQKIPGQNCTANDCAGPPPGYMAFTVAIWSLDQCDISGDLVAVDTMNLGGRKGARCVVEYPMDYSRTTEIWVRLTDGNSLSVIIEKGNSVAPGQQATLETMLSTFAFAAPVAPEGSAP